MVAISLSGSGEGLGRAIARGYSTGNDGKRACRVVPARRVPTASGTIN